MKLNAIQIDRYGIFNSFRMPELAPGFNLIYGGNGTGKSTLARYVRNVLYGFATEDLSDGGYVDVVVSHQVSRLVRDLRSGNRLVCKPVVSTGISQNVDPSPSILDAVGETAFDTVFHVRVRDASRSASNVANLLMTRFGVPAGKSVFGNEVEYATFSRRESELRDCINRYQERLGELKLNRDCLVREIDRIESESHIHVNALDEEIKQIESALKRINLVGLREQIAVLDSEISATRIRVEQNQERVDYVSRPFAQSDSVAMLYRRLDEVDLQIRQWRSVHADVQQQRVQLKDEMTVWNSMTVESNEHPYHRSREILREIESKIEVAENRIHDFRSGQDAQSAHTVINNIQDCFGNLRGNLYALCDELGAQYKSIRHRTAAAELKRLRRCYHEIGENIESLIQHRLCILEDIRKLDPAGAAAVGRADMEFCACAQHDGYLAARRKFVGELEKSVPEVVRVSDESGIARLKELENLRLNRVRELVALENESNALKANLSEKKIARENASFESTVALRDQLIQIDSEIGRIRIELTQDQNQLEQLKTISKIPAHPLMVKACVLVDRLTMGEIRKLWLSPFETTNGTGSPVQVEQKSGKQIEFEFLGSGLQQQVILALSLAAAEQYATEGHSMPMILDDVFVNLDPELIRQTFDALTEFARNGNQVVALSSDRSVHELCTNSREAVFDLPDTNFTPTAPRWNPDRKSDEIREPDFLTPFTTRPHEQVPVRPMGYPQVKYPLADTSMDHAASNFDVSAMPDVKAYHPVAKSPSTIVNNSIGENSRLELLRICSSDQLNRLSQVGITSISQLLEINPHQLPQQFADLGISQANIDSWQAISWLLICVPALQVEDAQILNALGIYEPEQLESTHSQQLLDRISRYLNSADGRSFERTGSYNRETINSWYDSLGQTRSKWRMPSGYSRRNRWNTGERARDGRRERGGISKRGRSDRGDRVAFKMQREGRSRRERAARDSRLENAVSRFSRQGLEQRNTNSDRGSAKPAVTDAVTTPSASGELKFYLDMSDQLDAAPSIGPKTAERFIKIGVRNINEFLTQTAESMAPKINYKRITAEVIRTWQHQARLVCRVPNLRGHDAQLLVACGITEPEDLAGRSPNKLFSIIQPFAESKEGLKIIRSGKQPDLQEITNWISWAQNTRSLQAA